MRSNYEEQAEAYGRHRSHNESLLRELVSGGGLTQGSRVLEIGAGTGDYIAALRSLVGSDCSAVEPAGAMREILLARVTGVRVRAGRAEELPLEAREFDFALCGASDLPRDGSGAVLRGSVSGTR